MKFAAEILPHAEQWLPSTVGIYGAWSYLLGSHRGTYHTIIQSPQLISSRPALILNKMVASLDNPGMKVTSPSRLAHVVLRTNNFDKMRAFYKTFLGAHATYENDFLSFLTYDEEHHRIAILSLPDVGNKVRASSGLEHVAFTFQDLDELATTYLQREKNGILPFWCVNHGPTTSVYYKDPDGNILETQVENFETTEEVIAFMESEAYNTNPIGVDFEMSDLIRRLKSDEDQKTIKARPASGPRGVDTVPE